MLGLKATESSPYCSALLLWHDRRLLLRPDTSIGVVRTLRYGFDAKMGLPIPTMDSTFYTPTMGRAPQLQTRFRSDQFYELFGARNRPISSVHLTSQHREANEIAYPIRA